MAINAFFIWRREVAKNETTSQEKPVRGKLLTVSEAAEYIRVGYVTLYDCIKRGEITFFRPPRGKILLDTADLDQWLRISKIPASTLPGNI
jgi:excisionase family DNA binding protein